MSTSSTTKPTVKNGEWRKRVGGEGRSGGPKTRVVIPDKIRTTIIDHVLIYDMFMRKAEKKNVCHQISRFKILFLSNASLYKSLYNSQWNVSWTTPFWLCKQNAYNLKLNTNLIILKHKWNKSTKLKEIV